MIKMPSWEIIEELDSPRKVAPWVVYWNGEQVARVRTREEAHAEVTHYIAKWEDQAHTREDILNNAIKHTCGDRDLEYGPPTENLGNIAVLWDAYLESKYAGQTIGQLTGMITSQDVAHLNVLQKMARTFSGKVKADTYEDMAAYAGIAFECATEEKE